MKHDEKMRKLESDVGKRINMNIKYSDVGVLTNLFCAGQYRNGEKGTWAFIGSHREGVSGYINYSGFKFPASKIKVDNNGTYSVNFKSKECRSIEGPVKDWDGSGLIRLTDSQKDLWRNRDKKWERE